PLVWIGDDDPSPALLVAARRGLDGEVETLEDHLARNRLLEVEALAHRARRREQFVDRQIRHVAASLIRRTMSSTSTASRSSLSTWITRSAIGWWPSRSFLPSARSMVSSACPGWRSRSRNRFTSVPGLDVQCT